MRAYLEMSRFTFGLMLAMVYGLSVVAPRECRAGASSPTRFSFDQPDKQMHMTSAFTLTLVSGLIYEHQFGLSRTKATIASMLTVLALATLKETMLDSRYSPADQVANGIGTGVGGITFLVFKL